MEGIDQDDVIQILRMLEESTFEELRLEMGEVKLFVSKSGQKTGWEKEPCRIPSERTEPAATPETVPQPVERGASDPTPDNMEEKGLTAIKAPMLGSFYRAPKPGAPPFVKVGQVVSEDDTVCIIEVMKLFNTVKANLRGRIAKICAEDGEMVEYQQTLFLVEESNHGRKDNGSDVP